jgi:HEAT repeat protein
MNSKTKWAGNPIRLILIALFLTGFSVLILAAELTVDQWAGQLKSPEAKARRRAAEELGKTGSREAVAPLLQAVQDPDTEVRRNVVRSLGQLRDQSAITMLLKAIEDSSSEVRRDAIDALVSLYVDPQSEFILTRQAKKVYKTINLFSDKVKDDPTVVRPGIQVNQAVIEGIARRLKDPDESNRMSAAYALGIFQAQQAIPQMLEAMQYGSAQLKIALLRSFYKIRDTSVADRLLPYMNDPDRDVKLEAITTLGLLRGKRALPTLRAFYEQGSDEKVRLKSMGAMALVGDPSVRELFRRVLIDPEAEYRQYGAEGLGRIADPTTVEELSRAFLSEKKQNVQIALSFALYQTGRKEYLDKLIESLVDRAYRQHAEAYLIEIGKPAVPQLLKSLDSPNAKIRERVCYVLGMIGDPAATEKMRLMLRDSTSEVVAEASTALGRLNSR